MIITVIQKYYNNTNINYNKNIYFIQQYIKHPRIITMNVKISQLYI